MPQPKKIHAIEKTILHPRNKHRERYDFKLLIASCPDLAPFVRRNDYNDVSIDFFNSTAVKMLNKALLKCYYDIEAWDIPPGYLCPPIPGRADYIHYVADLLASKNKGQIPTGNKIKCLDIGVGANCVYPLIGNKEYGWSFIGADIDAVAVKSANKILEANPSLKSQIEIRLQANPADIFQGIIKKGERFDAMFCNPPFHASWEEAQAGALRKLNNLTRKKNAKPLATFGGQNCELWYPGGEVKFVGEMIRQSQHFPLSCFWFTTLISKETTLRSVYAALSTAVEVKTILMGQGQKTSRIVAWTFLNPEQQQNWVQSKHNA